MKLFYIIQESTAVTYAAFLAEIFSYILKDTNTTARVTTSKTNAVNILQFYFLSCKQQCQKIYE